MENLVKGLLITVVIVLIGYSVVGTDGKVNDIREKAPAEMSERNWEIIRYEGFEYGSWGNHGGKVWYHVENIDNENIQYRVFVTIWNNELQWHYNEPEKLQRLEVDFNTND
tara:strand:+ start:1499 stop:1831 length:333 start_codon:yes stop_codon:yes gene_type:complete